MIEIVAVAVVVDVGLCVCLNQSGRQSGSESVRQADVCQYAVTDREATTHVLYTAAGCGPDVSTYTAELLVFVDSGGPAPLLAATVTKYGTPSSSDRDLRLCSCSKGAIVCLKTCHHAFRIRNDSSVDD